MKIIVGAILFLMFSFCLAYSVDSTNDTQIIADKMVNHFVKQEFQQGLAVVKPYWPKQTAEIDEFTKKIKTQLPVAEQDFGIATGQEFIREEKIGHSLIRYYFLHKFENNAMYWQITFYKPLNKWKVSAITLKDSIEPLYRVINDSI
jgi:hypothetical protein